MLGVTACFVRAQQSAPFHLQEATIGGIHSAFAAGGLTCAQLTRAYLDRIEAYNLKGPALRAIINVNPRAMDVAAEKDRQFKANPSGAGPFGTEQQAGNVWEWVSDSDPDGWGVVRGGSYLDTAWGLRASRAQPADPERATNTTGFRIAKGGTWREQF